ncbi:MAG: GNAT family N-acetyltransferase, partial [Planctomycetota bacterium]|nr:GNAT family N-acetyltransferase [Planctomycetota bacterium]
MAEDCRLRPFRLAAAADDVDGVVAVWNQSLEGHHGFFPLSAAILQARVLSVSRFRPERFLVATVAGEIVGFLHCDEVRESSYEPAAVVEALGVMPNYRRRGIAHALLAAALAMFKDRDLAFIDGGGAWPYSPFYATLIDGSERSGLFQDNAAALRLFARHGFRTARESIVMRRDLRTPLPEVALPQQMKPVEVRRETPCCWLDFVFRGWRLVEHDL